MVNNLKEALLVTYNTRDEEIKKRNSFEGYSKLVLKDFLKKGNKRAFTRTDGAQEYALSHNLYEEMERFLRENPLYHGKLENVKNRIKYDSYMWNYERLGQKYKYIFIERAANEFQEDLKEGNLNPEYFEWYKWKDLMKLIEDPIEYHTKKSLDKEVVYLNKKEYEKIVKSKSYRFAKGIVTLTSKLRGGIQCCRDHGTVYTFFYGIKKVSRYLFRRNKR